MTGRQAAAPVMPELECDVVMRGGVTSGIIYPGAVSEIAHRYRLRSIGGTSVGAIAAAAAAAMEFGRQTQQDPARPAMLAQLAKGLAEEGGGKTLLERLLVPAPSTRPLFDLVRRLQSAVAKAGGSILRVIRGRLIRTLLLGAVAGGLVAALLFLIDPSPQGWRLFHAAVMGLLVTLLATGVLIALGVLPLLRAPRVLVGNGYGLCPGVGATPGTEPGVIDWLHEQIQSLAGLEAGHPLTFGQLWMSDGRTKERAIDLTMITTDLTRGQLIQLPFFAPEDRIYASKSDLAAVLPAAVLAAMIEAAAVRDQEEGHDSAVPDGFIRLPKPADLPVLFAVRLSMSFPIVFSAVRLHLQRYPGSDDLVPIWFSDGGLTSNFPLHLFDAPIPGRPTFCLNLVDPSETFQDEKAVDTLPTDPAELDECSIRMARDNGSRIALIKDLERGTPSARLAGFAWRMVETARQWSDYAAMNAPGSRDRIVHVGLGRDEGGLRFDMTPDLISRIDERGRRAGVAVAERLRPGALVDPFNPDARLELGWDNHRFVRFRAFVAGLELAAAKFSRGWTEGARELVLSARGERPDRPYVGYRFGSIAQQNVVVTFADDAAKLGGVHWQEFTTDIVDGDHTSPRPKPVLRLRPAPDSDPAADGLPKIETAI